MVTEIAEPIAETREKSMAALAEILRENEVRVIQVIEPWVSNPARITFNCDSDSDALEIAEIPLEHGYRVSGLSHVWPFIRLAPSRSYWVMYLMSSSTELVV